MADNANLKAQYLAQVEADLERNAKEKDRLAADLAALQAQLTTLEQDHALLVGVRQTLADAASATDVTSLPEQGTDQAAAPAEAAPVKVPRARKPKAAVRTPKRSAAKKVVAAKAADKPAEKPADKPAEKPAAKSKSAAKGGGSGKSAASTPTLVELVTASLSGLSEPRSAAEVGTALVQAHPKRKIQTTVVRNTLEALVAKGQALRSKQGRSVYYSAAENAPATDAADSTAEQTENAAAPA